MVKPYTRLFERVNDKDVAKLVERSKADVAAFQGESKESKKDVSKKKDASKKNDAAASDTIDFKAFSALDLRVAKVVEATDVEGADRLLKLQLDVGDLGTRQVLSGVKPHIQASDMLGQNVILVANLAPRKMKFGVSEGMVLAAGDVPSLVVAANAKPGEKVS